MIRKVFIALIVTGLWACTTASASVVNFSLDNVVVNGSTTSATTGSVDVIFSGAAGTNVGAYDLDVLVNGPLTLTGYTSAPSLTPDAVAFTPYGGGEYGVALTFDSPYLVLGDSNVVGHFDFSVPANNFGTYAIAWVSDFTSGQDGGGTMYTLGLNNGSVTTVAPEPAGLSLLVGCGSLLLARRKRAGT